MVQTVFATFTVVILGLDPRIHSIERGGGP
jgi:hypothetical protein